jgi:hypothetical protein
MTFANRWFAVLIGITCLCSLLTAQQSAASQISVTVVPRRVNFSGKATDSQGKTFSGITGSGTLALNWTAAPTSLNTPHAIVKRDASGNLTVGVISAAVVNATNSTLNGTLTVGAGANISNAGGPAVVASTSSVNAATGTSTGANTVSDGVDGISNSAGVAGINNAGGIGVYGTGGTCVFGTGSAYGFQTDSNVQQARSAGGWVKAMVKVNGMFTPCTIESCFQLRSIRTGRHHAAVWH